ncbi:MAG: hypothetical protein WCP89_00375 [archaeon]
MVKITTTQTRAEQVSVDIGPIFASTKRTVLEERLEVHYDHDVTHEGGWEIEASWHYTPANEELLKEIIDERKKQGWTEKGKHIYPILERTIGDKRLKLNYFLEERQFSRYQKDRLLENWVM